MFLRRLLDDPAFYVTWCVLVTFSICVHEAAHAWTAAWRGDTTAWRQGYLTLNPLRVMGPLAMLMLMLFGVAWGAVPVDRRALRGRGNVALVALAGPLANLGLALAFGLAAGLFLVWSEHAPSVRVRAAAALFAATGLRANLFMFCFNALPIPPLDGWDIVGAFVPGMQELRLRLAPVEFLFILLLFVSPAGPGLWAASDWLTRVFLDGFLAGAARLAG